MLAPMGRGHGGVVVYDETLTEPVERWVGNGRTIRNNEGLPVRQYEPFFSTTSAFESEEELVEHGVTPVLHYDPLGRLVRTELPNGTQAHVEFSPWEQQSYDPNDAVLESSWYAERIALSGGDPERRAAELAEAHANTPTVTHLDHLGRAFLAVEHSRDALDDDVYHETPARLDVQGNVLRITDANGTVAEERVYGMLGQVLQTTSLEVGDRWALADVLGAPLYATASRGFSTRYRYDTARRATHTFVTRPDSSTFTATRIVYGEAAASPTASNLRGQVFRIYDGAGLHANEEFDVDGNLVRQSRCLAAAYDTTPDWSDLDELDDPADMDTATATLLETEVFTTEQSFDAMGRPVTKTSPDASVLHLGYGDAGHLETVAANVRGDVTETSFVSDLRYNARGQRTLIVYGNGTQTRYAYDPQTFRLTQVETRRVSDDHPHQDLRYTFDPVGNVVEIQDLAQPIVLSPFKGRPDFPEWERPDFLEPTEVVDGPMGPRLSLWTYSPLDLVSSCRYSRIVAAPFSDRRLDDSTFTATRIVYREAAASPTAGNLIADQPATAGNQLRGRVPTETPPYTAAS